MKSQSMRKKQTKLIKRSAGSRKLFTGPRLLLLVFTSLLVLVTSGLALWQSYEAKKGLMPDETSPETSQQSFVMRSVVLQAGEKIPEAAAFCPEAAPDLLYQAGQDKIDTRIPGIYYVQLKMQDQAYQGTLHIVDTLPPQAETIEQQIWLGDSVTAEQFVKNITDVTPVQVSFNKEPDLTGSGRQQVEIKLEDGSGNKTILLVPLEISKADQPPLISGAADQKVYIGDSILYRKGLEVTSLYGPEVELAIDNSAVNPVVPGTYPVRYLATDRFGNQSEIQVNFTVVPKPPGTVTEKELDVLADAVLAEIRKPGMDDLELLSEIFYWVAGKIKYVGSSDKSDWIEGAYYGITNGVGDCFNYFAAAKALLGRAGFETIPLERVARSRTRHYWNLVKYEGQWYHFDAMPNLTRYHYVCLLRTDAEVAEFNKTKALFYEFEREGIPATATEPLDIERRVING